MTLLEQANTLAQTGELIQALTLYAQVLAEEPNNAAAWNNQGHVQDDLKQREAALISFNRALEINPNYAKALCNKGVVLLALHQSIEALDCFDACLASNPSFAMAHNNRGNALSALGRFDEAITSFQQAYAIDSNFHDARWNQSLCMLLMGDYANGWVQYESRWQAPAPSGQMLETPRSTWLGSESIDGKKIILWPEGGDGDVFQFVRFAPLVQQMGAEVLLVVRANSFRLFEQSFPDIELLPMIDHTPVPASDYQSSLMSLPLACTIDNVSKVPAPKSYLAPPPLLQALWRSRLQGVTPTKINMRIGLCWAGNGITDVDQDRSLSLPQFDALTELAKQHNLQFVSLQKGAINDAVSALPLIDLTAELRDWADTAALIANLDLVICCDTGVAHLAAAVGKPTWILSRHNGCWRWLADRSDSPWYPSVRLFRQSAPGDWETVLGEVARALAAQLQHEN